MREIFSYIYANVFDYKKKLENKKKRKNGTRIKTKKRFYDLLGKVMNNNLSNIIQ